MTKKNVLLRLDVDLVDALDTIARRDGWANAHASMPGGIKPGDIGRTALITAVLRNFVHTYTQESNVIQVQIIQNGRPIPRITHNSAEYLHVVNAGEYLIQVKNTSFLRKMIVVSVDGINVVDGTDAAQSGAGFVIAGNTTQSIPGFLRSSQECARFTFAAADNSYAAQTGRGKANVGVIGVAVFDEEIVAVTNTQQAWPRPSFDTPIKTSGGILRAASYSCSIGNSVTTNSAEVGTAYGRAEAFHTHSVDFVPHATPSQLIQIHYGTTATLEAWGVPVPKARPNAFPATYAPAPPGWTR